MPLSATKRVISRPSRKESNELDYLQRDLYDVSNVMRNSHYEGGPLSDFETHPVDSDVDQFDAIYARLATAWDSHHALRDTYPPVSQLALSSLVLDEARGAMWAWWKANRMERP
jgi:hypothetical protein